MNHREIRRDIQVARAALKDFYAASDEVDWARVEVSRSTAVEQSNKNDRTLRQQSPLAWRVNAQVVQFVNGMRSTFGFDDPQSFYVKNRETMAEKLFESLDVAVAD